MNYRVEKLRPMPDYDDIPIWRDVYTQDEYKLANCNLADLTVLDIGANVGAFAAKCLDARAKKVVSVEPSSGSAQTYREVMSEQIQEGKAEILNVAAWSGNGKGWLSYDPQNPRAQTAMSVVLYPNSREGEECAFVSIKYLLEKYKPDVLKLDCEGSEYEILNSTIPNVRLMFIEFHEISKWGYAETIGRLTEYKHTLLKTDGDLCLWRFDRA